MKLMIPICAASWFVEMELGRESRKGQCRGQIIKYWHQIMCLHMEDLARQHSKWQNS